MTDKAKLDSVSNYGIFVADKAISALNSIDRDLREDGWRIEDGSTRGKIKEKIKEFEHYKKTIAKFIERDKRAKNDK